MSSVHVVAVWEWLREGASAGSGGGEAWWVPHCPAVSQQLERAHAKRLTRVVLADAEPSLRGTHVNLRTRTQTTEPDQTEGAGAGAVTECAVRRSCYSVRSPAGRGVRWEWTPPAPRCVRARASHAPLWEALPLQIQMALEGGAGAGVVRCAGWAWEVARGLATSAHGFTRVRRVVQPPYPLTRNMAATPPPAPAPLRALPAPSLAPAPAPALHSAPPTLCGRRAASASVGRAGAGGGAGGRAPSPPPRDKQRHNLARAILHNLNIFRGAGNDGSSGCSGGGGGRGGSGGDVEGAQRRHSVDTVSTYLSHESKDSLQCGSMGSLLNCSTGSDDVFEARPPQLQQQQLQPQQLQQQQLQPQQLQPQQLQPQQLQPQQLQPQIQHQLQPELQQQLQPQLEPQQLQQQHAQMQGQGRSSRPPSRPPSALQDPFASNTNGTLISVGGVGGGDGEGVAGGGVGVGVGVGVGRWVRGVSCVQWGAVCPGCVRPLSPPALALPCAHMLHERCLRAALRTHSHPPRLYLQCLVCGEVYGKEAESAQEVGPPPGGPTAPGGRGGLAGPLLQPSGTMAWSVQHGPLPGHPPHTNTILVTYNISSGVMGAEEVGGAGSGGGAGIVGGGGGGGGAVSYYAVGFPRHSHLPECALGRRVLLALRAAWERRALFTLTRSQTTGREWVVAWAPGLEACGALADRTRVSPALLHDLLRRLDAHAHAHAPHAHTHTHAPHAHTHTHAPHAHTHASHAHAQPLYQELA